MHEIVHGIHIFSGIETDEKITDQMAFGFIQVLRDNPVLIELIKEYF